MTAEDHHLWPQQVEKLQKVAAIEKQLVLSASRYFRFESVQWFSPPLVASWHINHLYSPFYLYVNRSYKVTDLKMEGEDSRVKDQIQLRSIVR